MITKDISYIKVTLPIICPKRVIERTILRYLFILVLQKMWNNHSCSTPTDFFSTNDVRIYEPLIIGILQPGDITEPDRQAELYVKSLALFLRPFVILHITWLNLNPFFCYSGAHCATYVQIYLWCSLVTPNNSEYFIFTLAIVWHEKILLFYGTRYRSNLHILKQFHGRVGNELDFCFKFRVCWRGSSLLDYINTLFLQKKQLVTPFWR